MMDHHNFKGKEIPHIKLNPDMSIEHDVDNQRKQFQELTQPLFDAHGKSENEKIWGLMHGNHEYKIHQISRAYLENLLEQFKRQERKQVLRCQIVSF